VCVASAGVRPSCGFAEIGRACRTYFFGPALSMAATCRKVSATVAYWRSIGFRMSGASSYIRLRGSISPFTRTRVAEPACSSSSRLGRTASTSSKRMRPPRR